MGMRRYLAAAFTSLALATAAQGQGSYPETVQQQNLKTLRRLSETVVTGYWAKFKELQADVRTIESGRFVLLPEDSASVASMIDYMSANPAGNVCIPLLREMYKTGREIDLGSADEEARLAMYNHAVKSRKKGIECMSREEKRLDELRSKMARIKNRA